ncbi:hypothetical protein AVEN_208307-1 [Araneus ventricosus]|uniref:Uncharacterized protein n=1 Tax=Araneus ventricosus TaxID=182803 RepID=A0A4Y2KTB5_ARAVE|nr:hypothetical protein AVEN_208307-1 [Araneus ventricosus]
MNCRQRVPLPKNCNFYPRSDDEDNTLAGTPSPQQRDDVWSPTYYFICNRPKTREIFLESGFEPGTLLTQSRDLSTRHRGLQEKSRSCCHKESLQQ